jgi:hypothetical protein
MRGEPVELNVPPKLHNKNPYAKKLDETDFGDT